jgi:hypothetical protein
MIRLLPKFRFNKKCEKEDSLDKFFFPYFLPSAVAGNDYYNLFFVEM